MAAISFESNWLGKDLTEQMTPRWSEVREAREKLLLAGHHGELWHGWLDYPKKAGFKELERVLEWVDNLDVYYDIVILIGIGGSYLGARAVWEAFASDPIAEPQNKPPLVFAGNSLSTLDLMDILEIIKKKDPIVNVVSKSGTTLEPGVAFRVINEAMTAKYGGPGARSRMVITTDESKGSLRALATSEDIRSFVVPDDIGGRFSVLSPVGLVPLALAGIDVQQLMLGAHRLFEELCEDDSHPALAYALARNTAYNSGKKVELLVTTEPRLTYLVEWWKQLFGESEGKNGQGLFPAGATYTTDLHSLGQYVQEGERILFETFLEFGAAASQSGVVRELSIPGDHDRDGFQYLQGKSLKQLDQMALKATQLAHYDGGVPSSKISVGALTSYDVGGLLAFFQVSCALSCLLMGVDGFIQPGVEKYKTNMHGLMDRPGFSQIGAEIKERIGSAECS